MKESRRGVALAVLLLVGGLSIHAPARAQNDVQGVVYAGVGAGLAVALIAPVGVAAGLASPVLAVEGFIPRPTAGVVRYSMAGETDTGFVSGGSAGAYFPGADWLGLEGRGVGFVSGNGDETISSWGYAFDWLVLVRPTPLEVPVHVELFAGPSLHADFYEHFDGGVSAGARASLRVEWFFLETDAIYRAHWGTDHPGARHRVEVGPSLGFAAPAIRVSLGYRYLGSGLASPTEEETHRFMASWAWVLGSPSTEAEE